MKKLYNLGARCFNICVMCVVLINSINKVAWELKDIDSNAVKSDTSTHETSIYRFKRSILASYLNGHRDSHLGTLVIHKQ